MTSQYKIYDNLKKCWFKPTYEGQKGNIEEILFTQRGEIVLRTLDENGNSVLTHESALKFKDTQGKKEEEIAEAELLDRFTPCKYSGLKDNKGTKIYNGDVIKNENWISFVRVEQTKIWVASGDSKHPHALDKVSTKEIEQSEIIGNVFETPEYWLIK